ncbi:hypothetical protein GQR58_024427 [Nymphon striatum]|nr:hypothetical protein GQR58_024427 [Nymphon striatum]KAG1655595.1 hypothetical protein GQR58_024427 [Nymphon striatum]KAG1655596.1 hypothetical protein GQR58_024427 [Nymphon striatum]
MSSHARKRGFQFSKECLEVIAHGMHNDEGFDVDLAEKVLLQKEARDIVSAVLTIEEVKLEYQKYFEGVYNHAIYMAASVGTGPKSPRTAKKQTHHESADSNGPLQYYLRNIGIPFIDHIIVELDDASVSFDDLKASAELYKKDTIVRELAQFHLHFWERKFEPKYATDEEGEESLSSSQSSSEDDEKASRIGEQS